jgi:hypothetical protein
MKYVGRPRCEFCGEKISIFEDYEYYEDEIVHKDCRDEKLNKLIRDASSGDEE